MKTPSFTLLCGLALLGISAANTAHATLGQPESSVDGDIKALSGTENPPPATHSVYTIREIQNGSIAIREYIFGGNVFGIAWSGVATPDLRVLLGSYFKEFKDEQEKKPHKPGRRNHTTQTAHVTVESWGHMRSMYGHAFIASLIPNGVKANEIQ